MTRSTSVFAVLLLAGALSGCAAIQQSDAMSTERQLSAAGFQMRLADTDEKLAQIQELPQRKLTPRQEAGRLLFVYADARFCKCIYVGTERARQRYERMAMVERVVQERQETAEDLSDASMDLGEWGPWGPWF